ncbi:antitoxin Xre-like helix-turn-helix domain-containing protein [Massilia sp. SR12]
MSKTRIAEPLIKRAMSASKARRHSSVSSTAVEFSAVHSCLGWYQMSATEKIRVIRSGLPAQLVVELSSVMGVPKVTLINALRLSRATVNRKIQLHKLLSRDESERVLGLQSLIGQVQSMTDAERKMDFDAAKWLGHWLREPLPALGGNTPASYLDTVLGGKYVGDLLAMAEGGIYA